MYLNLEGHNMNVGKTLEKYVTDRMNSQVKKNFRDAVSAEVIFQKSNSRFTTSISIKEGLRHNHLIAQGVDMNIYKSFNMALQKITRQLRKFKTRSRNHKGVQPLKEIYAS